MERRLEVGMVIHTNYNESCLYQIVEIQRDCRCPNYVELINNPSGARKSKPHMHITCRLAKSPEKRDLYHLSGYDEKTLRSVWNKDRIIIVGDIVVPARPIQATLDLKFREEDDG